MRRHVGERQGHDMPASLVNSQFAVLEAPRGDADVIEISSEADLTTLIPQWAGRVRTQFTTGDARP